MNTFLKNICFLLFAILIISINLPVGATYNTLGLGICECDSCSDCTNALNDNTNCYAKVKLTVNISNVFGSCIDNPVNFSNKVFDCQGNIIEGDNSGTDYGIYLLGKQNNSIMNCNISDFTFGIFIDASQYINLTGNTLYSNTMYGIKVLSSINNILINNTAYSTGTEASIQLENSSNNTLMYNDAKYTYYCILVEGGSKNNFVVNNTLESCTFGFFLPDTQNNLIIANTIKSNTNSGIYMFANSSYNNISNNIILNNGQTGIKLTNCDPWGGCGYSGNVNNTFTDNFVSSNYNNHGIYLTYSSNNTFVNNIIIQSIYGIYLYDEANNNLFDNNRVENNSGSGFYVASGSNTGNILNWNIFCSNTNYDIYDSDSNMGDNNICNRIYNWNDNGTTGCTFSCGDDAAPTIQFVEPTETSGSTISRSYVLINVTSSDSQSGVKNITVYLYNASGFLINSSTSETSPLFVNFTDLSDGLYLFNATAYDNARNSNFTETRNVTILSVSPENQSETPTEVPEITVVSAPEDSSGLIGSMLSALLIFIYANFNSKRKIDHN